MNRQILMSEPEIVLRKAAGYILALSEEQDDATAMEQLGEVAAILLGVVDGKYKGFGGQP
jgi:hypothetical protein